MLSTAETPARPRSEAQREASRRNGAKGTGPKPENRHITKRNAPRHGHRAEVVLPPDLQAEAAAKLAMLEECFAPTDDYERSLVARAAGASARLARLDRAELIRASELVRTAIDRWDARRAEEVEALAALLETDPATAVRKLRGTCEGCDFMADSWLELDAALDRDRTWTEEEVARALHLLGHLDPSDPAASWLPELAEYAPTEPEDLTILKEMVTRNLAELVERGTELWENHDKLDRQAAPSLASFDPSPEGRLLARYQAEAERVYRRATAELDRYRRQAPNEPGKRRREEPPARPQRLQRPQGEESSAPRSSFASSASLREIFPPPPAPNEPEPLPAIEPLPVAIAPDPAARKRRPDPAKLLRRARR